MSRCYLAAILLRNSLFVGKTPATTLRIAPMSMSRLNVGTSVDAAGAMPATGEYVKGVPGSMTPAGFCGSIRVGVNALASAPSTPPSVGVALLSVVSSPPNGNVLLSPPPKMSVGKAPSVSALGVGIRAVGGVRAPPPATAGGATAPPARGVGTAVKRAPKPPKPPKPPSVGVGLSSPCTIDSMGPLTVHGTLSG